MIKKYSLYNNTSLDSERKIVIRAGLFCYRISYLSNHRLNNDCSTTEKVRRDFASEHFFSCWVQGSFAFQPITDRRAVIEYALNRVVNTDSGYAPRSSASLLLFGCSVCSICPTCCPSRSSCILTGWRNAAALCFVDTHIFCKYKENSIVAENICHWHSAVNDVQCRNVLFGAGIDSTTFSGILGHSQASTTVNIPHGHTCQKR